MLPACANCVRCGGALEGERSTMARIVIDARESGTSTGRYIDKFIEYLYKLPREHEYIILVPKHRLEFMRKLAPRFEIVLCPYKEFTFAEQFGFAWQLYKLKADLVHFGMVQQPLLYFGRSVTSMQDLTTTRFRNPAKNYIAFTLKQQVYKLVNFIVAHKSKRILTISNFVREDVAKYARISPDKISVTYLAADKITEPSKPLIALKDKHYILYVGRPQPHKNLKRLIQATDILRKTYPNITLALAGKTDALYKDLEAYTRKKGIKNVYFTGWIDEGELRWLYENALVYAFPSLSEGFGLPGLEAMQYNLPVVSSNATCLPEIYGDAALYFDPKDPASIAKTIEELLGNKRLAVSQATKGSLKVKEYSWKRMAEQTLAVYSKVLQAK